MLTRPKHITDVARDRLTTRFLATYCEFMVGSHFIGGLEKGKVRDAQGKLKASSVQAHDKHIAN